MRRLARAAGAIVCLSWLAGPAIAQDLPPGVLLLSRVKRHVREELQRLPNISCLETVDRERQAPSGKMQQLDTVRLEVLTNGDKELFASPGERKFSERHPTTYMGSGMFGTGLFGMYLKSLVNGSLSNQYKGEEEIGGRRLARYDYRMPLVSSGYTITIPEGSGMVGFHGSYWADPQTYDVIRLERYADDFPPTLPLIEAVTVINYARTRLAGDIEVLLPESAEIRMGKLSGEISHNRIMFTHCRVFGAESSIVFGTPGAAEQVPAFGAASVDDTLRSLPGGLQIAVKLRSRITADMAVGTLIDGEVAAGVTRKGALAIAAGSPVRGRIRRLERYTDSSPYYFLVALEFTEIEIERIRHRFFADVVEIQTGHGVEKTLTFPGRTETLTEKNRGTDPRVIMTDDGTLVQGAAAESPVAIRRTRVTVSTPELPGVATFFVKGGSLDLPPGFRTVWRTRPLAR
jgi:hypothetical protein